MPSGKRDGSQIGYYACITHLDNQIGKLVDALKDDGSYQNTVILFVSDHGELLGDHYTFRKTRPYQGSIHIPLIVANAPGMIPGTVCTRLAELRDILPTLVELAGGEQPEGIGKKGRERSLRRRKSMDLSVTQLVGWSLSSYIQMPTPPAQAASRPAAPCTQDFPRNITAG